MKYMENTYPKTVWKKNYRTRIFFCQVKLILNIFEIFYFEKQNVTEHNTGSEKKHEYIYNTNNENKVIKITIK